MYDKNRKLKQTINIVIIMAGQDYYYYYEYLQTKTGQTKQLLFLLLL